MGNAVACGVVGVGGWSSFCEPQSGVAHGKLRDTLKSVAGDRPVIPGLTLHTVNRVASRRAHRPATRRATRRTECSHPACGRGAGYVQESCCAHARATGTIDHDGDASGCLTNVVWSASRAARRVGRLPLVTFLPLVGRGRDPESWTGGIAANKNWQRGWTGVGTVVKQVASGSHGDGSCCGVVVWIAAHASRVAVVGWSVSLYSALMTILGRGNQVVAWFQGLMGRG